MPQRYDYDNDHEEVSASDGKRTISIRGREVVLVVMILILMFFVGYLVMFSLGNWGAPINIGQAMVNQSQQISNTHAEISKTMSEAMQKHAEQIAEQHKEHANIVDRQHEIFRQTVDELTYVMSLTPEQRSRLGLEMPESLHKKLGGRGRQR